MSFLLPGLINTALGFGQKAIKSIAEGKPVLSSLGGALKGQALETIGNIVGQPLSNQASSERPIIKMKPENMINEMSMERVPRPKHSEFPSGREEIGKVKKIKKAIKKEKKKIVKLKNKEKKEKKKEKKEKKKIKKLKKKEKMIKQKFRRKKKRRRFKRQF